MKILVYSFVFALLTGQVNAAGSTSSRAMVQKTVLQVISIAPLDAAVPSKAAELVNELATRAGVERGHLVQGVARDALLSLDVNAELTPLEALEKRMKILDGSFPTYATTAAAIITELEALLSDRKAMVAFIDKLLDE